jgi:hypothetical protein
VPAEPDVPAVPAAPAVQVNQTLPTQAEGHIKHDVDHMLAGFSLREH